MNRQSIIFWAAVSLAAVGLISNFVMTFSLTKLLIPVAMLIIIFLLYKFPPKRYRRAKRVKIKPSVRTMKKVEAARRQQGASPAKRKSYPFQVIEGQKGKDEQTPKYH